ncbi:MAG: MarR family transcriptional regulator [Methanobrevibacter sp.]|uniref:MarR family winged helix-turn-helix transcriptional regulator n=1 Tax=Methanobrevibacter sp. TaxID=66852 RepID=UPI0025F71084|nr:MarR family transcriptional regulator [Methanobrevibacter sp.]MBR0272140.1 MarR family transcriptional regulator [Methanobrevibacter sp.]
MANLNFDEERLEITPFFYFINYLNVLHDNFLKENFKEITPRDFTYLSNIYYNPGISQKELAELLYVSESNVAQIIKRLEKSGQVRREVLKDNKGRKVLSLTEKGEDVFNMLLDMICEGEDHYFSDYSDEDKRKFKEMLYLFCEKSTQYEKLKYSWDHK